MKSLASIISFAMVSALAGCTVTAKLQNTIPDHQAKGVILPSKEASIFPDRDGIVESMKVNLGDEVQNNQLVATLLPSHNQQELAAELAYKRQGLAIAQERMNVQKSQQDQLEEVTEKTTNKEREAKIREIDAHIKGIGIQKTQQLKTAENAILDLIEAASDLLFTKKDALTNFGKYVSSDHYRRKELYYPKDAEAKKFEEELIMFYKEIQNGYMNTKPEIRMQQAIDIGRKARLLSSNLSESLEFTADQANYIRNAIDEATNRILTLSTDILRYDSDIAGHQAAKDQLLSNAEREQIEFKGVQKNTELDTKMIIAEIEQIKQRMNGDRNVYAPFAGVITKRFVNSGDSVDLWRPLYTIVDDSSTFVRFFVEEKDFQFIHEGSEVEFSTTFETDTRYKATITRIARAIDPETKNIQVEATINPDQTYKERILPQMSVYVYFDTKKKK